MIEEITDQNRLYLTREQLWYAAANFILLEVHDSLTHYTKYGANFYVDFGF